MYEHETYMSWLNSIDGKCYTTRFCDIAIYFAFSIADSAVPGFTA